MTYLALIPPAPHLEDFVTDSTYQMMLAHMCGTPGYAEFYTQQACTSFVILDNSAFELGASSSDMATLLAMGCAIGCQEIVAPDVIQNPDATLGRAYGAASFLGSPIGRYAWECAGEPSIMVVPQVAGESIPAIYIAHAQDLFNIYLRGAPYLEGYLTIGVSKNMDLLHGGWPAVFEAIQPLIDKYSLEVHALGMPKRLQNVAQVLNDHPEIRSIDTALPFVMAVDHHRRFTNVTEVTSKRRSNYLHASLYKPAQDIAVENIEWLLGTLGLHS